MRAALFNALYWSASAFYVLMIAVLSVFPGKGHVRWAMRRYARRVLDLMRSIAGITVTLKGQERLPPAPFIIAAKHQSWGDGYALIAHFDDITFVTGDHLEKFPLMAGVLRKLGAIVVDNCGGEDARRRLAASFEVAAAEGRIVLIYPEGHLSKVGEHFPYRSGVWHMQQASGWPVVPVATNLGLFWAQQDFAKTPGQATTAFLDPIPAGLDKEAFIAALTEACEAGTALLVAEARGGEPVRATLVRPPH